MSVLEIILIATVCVLTLLLIFTIKSVKNLLYKVEFYEVENLKLSENIDTLQEYLTLYNERIVEAAQKLKIVDIRGAFEADDEVGVAFRVIKNTLVDLSEFIEIYNEDANAQEEK